MEDGLAGMQASNDRGPEDRLHLQEEKHCILDYQLDQLDSFLENGGVAAENSTEDNTDSQGCSNV